MLYFLFCYVVAADDLDDNVDNFLVLEFKVLEQNRNSEELEIASAILGTVQDSRTFIFAKLLQTEEAEEDSEHFILEGRGRIIANTNSMPVCV